MKKLNLYEINDGLDGLIIAKSLKQAAKKLSFFNSTPVHLLMEELQSEDTENYDSTYILTCISKRAKKKEFKKSMFLGWCE